jgi:hypothetical protein
LKDGAKIHVFSELTNFSPENFSFSLIGGIKNIKTLQVSFLFLTLVLSILNLYE